MEENIVKQENVTVFLVKFVLLVILKEKSQLKQKKLRMKILGIGNAIVDVICKVDDNFINQNNLTKGTMKLIFDEKEFKLMLSNLKALVFLQFGRLNNQVIQKNTGIGIGTILIPYSVLSILSSSSSFDNNNTYLLFLFTCTIGMSLISFFKYCIHFAIGKLLLEENNRNNMIRYYSSEALSLLTTCYILQTVTGSFGKMNVHSNSFFQFAFVLTILSTTKLDFLSFFITSMFI